MYTFTGPGKAGTYSDPVYFDFIIYNFDIEGHALKPEHRKYLDAYIVPKLLAGWMFILQGTASKTGAAGYDTWLSEKRAQAVRVYLEQKLLRTLPNLSVQGIGKDNPIGAQLESGLDRAVRIYGWNQPVPPPPPKPRPQAKPVPVPEIGPAIQPATDGPTIEFYLKMLYGASIGPRVVQGEVQRFLLMDRIHGKAAYFDRVAVGGGIPVPLPGSFTQEGEENRIVLHNSPPMRLTDFDGAITTFTSRGTADIGVTGFTIKPASSDFKTIVIDKLKTGFTWGFSIQTGTAGTFTLDKNYGVFDRKYQ